VRSGPLRANLLGIQLIAPIEVELVRIHEKEDVWEYARSKHNDRWGLFRKDSAKENSLRS
jgi:hypothetical protein